MNNRVSKSKGRSFHSARTPLLRYDQVQAPANRLKEAVRFAQQELATHREPIYCRKRSLRSLGT